MDCTAVACGSNRPPPLRANAHTSLCTCFSLCGDAALVSPLSTFFFIFQQPTTAISSAAVPLLPTPVTFNPVGCVAYFLTSWCVAIRGDAAATPLCAPRDRGALVLERRTRTSAVPFPPSSLFCGASPLFVSLLLPLLLPFTPNSLGLFLCVAAGPVCSDSLGDSTHCTPPSPSPPFPQNMHVERERKCVCAVACGFSLLGGCGAVKSCD